MEHFISTKCKQTISIKHHSIKTSVRDAIVTPTRQGGRRQTGYRPRARTLLITRLRPKGWKVVPEPKFYADFKNPFLNCRKWGDLGEKVVFRNLPSTIFSKNRKIF